MKRSILFVKTKKTLDRFLIVTLCVLLVLGLQSGTKRAEADIDAAVTYDDGSSSIIYTGAWTAASSANAMAQTLHWTDVQGRKATLDFDGSQISYFYSMANNRGKAFVYIDDELQAQVDAYAPEVRRQVGKTWSLTSGSHTIEVVVGGGGSNGNFTDLDAFAVDIANVGTGVYDNTHAHVRYFGAWSDSAYTVATYNNSLKVSNTAQSGFRFTFVGDEISYLYNTSSNRGKVAVTIDGVNKGVYDQFTSDQRRQQGITFSGLGGGIHILNVVNTGTKNSASSDYYMSLDALVVGNVYNRTAAVSYADQWAHGRNGNYPNYGNPNDNPCNDCTNYVSQVLEAGGMPQIADVYQTNNIFYWFTYWAFGWGGSNTWQVTSAPNIASFKTHIEAFPVRYTLIGTTSPAVASLSGGDFFLMDDKSNPYVGADHASVIVGVGTVQEGDQLGQIRLLRNAHCNDRFRVRWDYGIEHGIDDLWAYRVTY